MKRILFILGTVSIITSSARAQDTSGCPLPCYKQSFPYTFCTATGAQITKCSTNPDSEPGLVAAKSYMPGCVNVVPIDPSLDYQPAGPIPIENCGSEPFPGPLFPPDRQTIWDRYVNSGFRNDGFFVPPYFRTYTYHPEDWNSEEEYDSAISQWNLDSSNFLNGLDPEHIGNTGDQSVDTGSHWYYDNDYGWLNEELAHEQDSVSNDSAEEAQWLICDSTFRAQNAAGTDVPYEQVWNNTQASSDAQAGLNDWLALCHLHGDPNCCILIKPDNNIKNWQGDYNSNPGRFPLGFTYGKPGCPDGGCPNANDRYIIYNATNAFFYRNDDNLPHPDPSFILYPSSPLQGWYTGDTAPISQYGIYHASDYSFKQTAEHEIGHFLGMLHPDDTTTDGSKCVNNNTHCHVGMLMEFGGMSTRGIDAIGLQPDDACMFQKLYCPGTGYDGVSASPQQPEPPSPEIFPNPTTGACQLQYELLDRAFVQVAIYDVLGNQMRLVSSDYEEAGTRTIPLGTESLPSGHYVCRVRVGGTVTYLNVAVER